MKAKNHSKLLTIAVAAMSLNIITMTAQSVETVESLKNRAIAASPRAKEAFPWINRGQSPRTQACCSDSAVRNDLTDARKNRAFAASPRALEQFPELARSAAPRTVFTMAPLVEKNAAVLSSPRTREEFPALSRGLIPATAKGGAAKLMELGR